MAAYFENGSPAMAQLTAIVDRLEQMVDHAGLAKLFYALEHVCSAKARTNPSSAWHWMSLANTMAQGRKPTCITRTDSANAGTEIAGEFPTTRGNFRPAHILFDDYSRGRER